MKTRKRLVLAAALAVSFLTFGVASREARADCACEEDADRLCAGVEPGEGRVWTCLLNNESELSGACRGHLKRRSGKAGPAKPAAPPPPAISEDIQKMCRSDRKKYCKYVNWEDGRVTKCLRIHDSQISEKCRAALEP